MSLLRFGRQRRRGEQLLPLGAGGHDHKLVGAERLAVEEHAARQAERCVEIRLGALFGQHHRIDAKGFQKAIGDGAVRPRAVDRQGPAVHQLQPAAGREFIALGVTADIVVVVEDQNARGLVSGAVEVRRREPADAAADDDQIVILAGRGDRAGLRPEVGVAQRVGGLETARMIAAQSGQRRRIISGGILRASSARAAVTKSGNNPPPTAPPMAMATPLRKSRRVMELSMPETWLA